MSGEPILSEDDELAAAELALGLADADDLRAAEARLTGDPAFRAAHARWQDYAVAMLSGEGEAPRPSIWNVIERRLPANDVAPANGSVRWWQASTAVASAAALVLGVVTLRPIPVPQASTAHAPPPVVARSEPAMIAVLVGDKDNGAIAVSYDPASGKLTLTPTRLDVGKRAAELWVIPAGQKPRSLGVIETSSLVRRNPRTDLARDIQPGATLAVSSEPIGGSPTGQPTGPVLWAGTVSAT